MKFRSQFLRLVVCSGILLSGAAAGQTDAPTPQAPVATTAAVALEITGTVKSGNTPLPGVAVTAAHSLTGKKVSTSTDVDGSFRLVIPNKGKWLIRTELSAFAAQTA